MIWGGGPCASLFPCENVFGYLIFLFLETVLQGSCVLGFSKTRHMHCPGSGDVVHVVPFSPVILFSGVQFSCFWKLVSKGFCVFF